MTMRAAILTVSDRCFRNEARDESGPALAQRVRERLGMEVAERACVPDERERIEQTLRSWAFGAKAPALILTTGGTGLGPRDVTPEATLAVVERRHSGLVELMRLRTGAENPRAYLSRAEAGAAGRSLIVNLPGSVRGAVECFDAVADILPHALGVLAGEDHNRDAPRDALRDAAARERAP